MIKNFHVRRPKVCLKVLKISREKLDINMFINYEYISPLFDRVIEFHDCIFHRLQIYIIERKAKKIKENKIRKIINAEKLCNQYLMKFQIC